MMLYKLLIYPTVLTFLMGINCHWNCLKLHTCTVYL